jgi:hypothetical protein
MRSMALCHEYEGGIGLFLREIRPSEGRGGYICTLEAPKLAPYC